MDKGFEETTETLGLPLGGTDAEIRAQIKNYENDIIDINTPGAGWTQTRHNRLRQNRNIEPNETITENTPSEPNDSESESETEDDGVYVDNNSDLNDIGMSTRGKVKLKASPEANQRSCLNLNILTKLDI